MGRGPRGWLSHVEKLARPRPGTGRSTRTPHTKAASWDVSALISGIFVVAGETVRNSFGQVAQKAGALRSVDGAGPGLDPRASEYRIGDGQRPEGQWPEGTSTSSAARPSTTRPARRSSTSSAWMLGMTASTVTTPRPPTFWRATTAAPVTIRSSKLTFSGTAATRTSPVASAKYDNLCVEAVPNGDGKYAPLLESCDRTNRFQEWLTPYSGYVQMTPGAAIVNRATGLVLDVWHAVTTPEFLDLTSANGTLAQAMQPVGFEVVLELTDSIGVGVDPLCVYTARALASRPGWSTAIRRRQPRASNSTQRDRVLLNLWNSELLPGPGPAELRHRSTISIWASGASARVRTGSSRCRGRAATHSPRSRTLSRTTASSSLAAAPRPRANRSTHGLARPTTLPRTGRSHS